MSGWKSKYDGATGCIPKDVVWQNSLI